MVRLVETRTVGTTRPYGRIGAWNVVHRRPKAMGELSSAFTSLSSTIEHVERDSARRVSVAYLSLVFRRLCPSLDPCHFRRPFHGRAMNTPEYFSQPSLRRPLTRESS